MLLIVIYYSLLQEDETIIQTCPTRSYGRPAVQAYIYSKKLNTRAY